MIERNTQLLIPKGSTRQRRSRRWRRWRKAFAGTPIRVVEWHYSAMLRSPVPDGEP